jgi:hypothetical protein
MLTRTNTEKQLQRKRETHRTEKHMHRENTTDERDNRCIYEEGDIE